MTDPAPDPYPWLPLASVRSWLKIMDDESSHDVDAVRQAAADWVQDQRRDLFVAAMVEGDPAVFTPSPAVVQAAVLAAARLWSRRGSPAGLAAFAEFGAAEVLRSDPDVTRLVRTGKPLVVG